MSELFAALTDGSGHPNRWPMALRLASQTEARRLGADWAPSHIISIYGPQSRYLGLADFPPERHLHLRFEENPEAGAATMADIEATIAFIDALPKDATLLIHCLQGTTRSAGIALGLLARTLPADKAGAALFKAYPQAAPTAHVVALWDEKLKLGGKLVKAGRKFPNKVLRQAPVASLA